MISETVLMRKRLKEALEAKDLRPVDLCRKTHISQSTMSQYLSGYAEPKKNRLTLIANTLNVSPAWLMGFDDTEFDLYGIEQLNKDGIAKVQNYINDILKIDSYRK